MALSDLKDVSYYRLNNQVNIPTKDNKIQLEKDKEALQAFLKENVIPNTKKFNSIQERLKYLIKHDYIEKGFIKKYKTEFIDKLYKFLEDQHFEFHSFMAAYKFYAQYAMKTNDNEYYLENYIDRTAMNALFLSDGNEELAMSLADELIHQRFQPATPTFLNAGKSRRGEFVSCFLIQTTDNMDTIGRMINSALQLSRIGGGVGINLSNLREAGAPIKHIKGASSGVLPVMKLLEDSFSYSNQLGQRNGAGVVYLSVFHPDIINFLAVKKENADEKIRVNTLSLGVTVPDKFYELARKNKDMYLFSPYDVEREYGEPFSYVDITKEYDNMVANKNIHKTKIKARDLETELGKLQQESGYPYIVNIDTANNENAIDGKIVMSNLCVTGDTELLTNDGYKTAKELYDEGKDLKVVLDDRTTGKKENGVSLHDAIPMHLTAKDADVYEVNTKQGFRIKSTKWHKYYVSRNNEIIKLPLSELKIGDKLLIQSGEGTYGKNTDTELAFVMGVISGDGTISDDNNVKLDLHDDKKVYADKLEKQVANIIKKYNNGRTYKHNANFEPKFHERDRIKALSSAILGRILNEEFNFNKETKLNIPKYVKNGTKQVQCAFLSGLFKTDGCFYFNKEYKNASIQLETTNKEFAQEIQQLLINMNIYSTIYKRDARRDYMPDGHGGLGLYNCNATYRVTIQDNTSIEKFFNNIELKNIDITKYNDFVSYQSAKAKKRKSTFSRKYIAEISSINLIGKENVYDTTQKEFHSLIFNGIVTGNCSEVCMVQKPSVFNDEQQEVEKGTDISCNLGSTNIVNLMESKDFGKSVDTMIRALTYVTDHSNISTVPTIERGNNLSHSIGLGAMGLHSYLALNQINYEDKEAVEFISTYFMLLNYWSLVSSNKIAKERHETFHNFNKSKYADGTYFDKYLGDEDFAPSSKKVKSLFKDIFIPTKKDWKELKKNVMKYGLYHQNRMAVAPNGSTSYIGDATASLAPIVSRIEERQEQKTGTIFYPAPYLSNKTMPYYKSAYDIDMRKEIDIYAAAQKHTDQSLSMTLFMRSTIPEGMYEWKEGRSEKMSTRDLTILRNYAHNKGIKSIYYVRTFTDDNDERGINECESCSI